jgi:endoglucanase
MKPFHWLIAVIASALPIFAAAPHYPFPQKVKYNFGILPASASSDKVQAAYDIFVANLYEESGDKARIKWDQTDKTVSEGIGYGMIIMVYMDNAANSTQAKFDKLWKYYNGYLDNNGLMNWKINGFGSAAEMGSASDAELDVAVGLMEAYKQWGDEKYLNDAKSFIDKIMKAEVNSAGFIKPGDGWDSKKNPSYFSTAAMKLFKNASSADWGKVVTNSYALLGKVRDKTTGLVPDWCSQDGQPQGDFSYDAVRVPWRMAWAYCWNGDDSAKAVCSSIATWISTKTSGDPAKIGDKYKLNGDSITPFHNGTWVGCLASPGLVDEKHRAWLEASYGRLADTLGKVKEVYYSQTLKVMNLLLMTGNMPDFWNMPTVGVRGTSENRGKAHPVPVISVDHRRNVINVSMTPGVYIINIFNCAGRHVYEPLFGRSEGPAICIPLTKDLKSGAYWLSLLTTSGSSMTRMVVTR